MQDIAELHARLKRSIAVNGRREAVETIPADPARRNLSLRIGHLPCRTKARNLLPRNPCLRPRTRRNPRTRPEPLRRRAALRQTSWRVHIPARPRHKNVGHHRHLSGARARPVSPHGTTVSAATGKGRVHQDGCHRVGEIAHVRRSRDHVAAQTVSRGITRKNGRRSL